MTNTPRKIDPSPVRIVDGLAWVANTSLVIGGYLYTRGCVVPAEVLNAIPNREALIQHRRVVQRAKTVEGITPRKLESTPAKIEHRQAIVAPPEDGDVLERWALSIVLTTEASGCNEIVARDLLMASRDGGELYRQAVRVDAERASIAQRTVGRRISRAI